MTGALPSVPRFRRASVGRALAATLVAAFAVACAPSPPATIANAAEPAVLRLVAPDPSRHVTALRLEATGEIEGSGELALLLDGKPLRRERIEGRVDLRWESDWYSPQAEVHYRPISARGGRIELRHAFKTL